MQPAARLLGARAHPLHALLQKSRFNAAPYALRVVRRVCLFFSSGVVRVFCTFNIKLVHVPVLGVRPLADQRRHLMKQFLSPNSTPVMAGSDQRSELLLIDISRN